jgi:hypothetical protein
VAPRAASKVAGVTCDDWPSHPASQTVLWVCGDIGVCQPATFLLIHGEQLHVKSIPTAPPLCVSCGGGHVFGLDVLNIFQEVLMRQKL